jgi:hypothetical protein
MSGPGTDRAEAFIAALDAPAAEQAQEGTRATAVMGSPQWSAQRLADRLLAQDAKQEAGRRKDVPEVAVEEYDAERSELRRWALQQAAMAEPVTRFGQEMNGTEWLPGGQLVLVQRARDGAIERMTAASYTGETILPHQWAEHDKQWQARQRITENELLSRHFGADRCITSGLFSEADRAQLDPARSRHVPLMRGLEGM